MRRFLLVFVLLLGLAARADAVTLRELVDLSKQGLSDEILIALVEAEASVFHLDAADVRSLKEQGLSDRLVIHLLQTPSLRPVPEPMLHIADARPPPPAPATVVIIDRVRPVAVPVFVPVRVERPARSERRDARRARDADRDGVKDDERRAEKPAPAVYWGFGGQRRPDAWRARGRR